MREKRGKNGKRVNCIKNWTREWSRWGSTPLVDDTWGKKPEAVRSRDDAARKMKRKRENKEGNYGGAR